MISDFLYGLAAYLRALSKVLEPKYMKYIWYSGWVSLLTLLLLGVLLFSLKNVFAQFWDNLSIFNIDFSGTIGGWATSSILVVGLLAVYKYIVLIVTAPLMSRLSEKLEQDLHGYDHTERVTGSFFIEMLRGLRISLRNVIRELVLTGGLLILSLFPGLAIVTGPLIFGVQSYFAGFGNYDFWAERHFSFKDTVKYMKSHKSRLIANGGVFLLLLYIPIIGVFLGPPLATIASTLHAEKDFVKMT